MPSSDLCDDANELKRFPRVAIYLDVLFSWILSISLVDRVCSSIATEYVGHPGIAMALPSVSLAFRDSPSATFCSDVLVAQSRNRVLRLSSVPPAVDKPLPVVDGHAETWVDGQSGGRAHALLYSFVSALSLLFFFLLPMLLSNPPTERHALKISFVSLTTSETCSTCLRR